MKLYLDKSNFSKDRLPFRCILWTRLVSASSIVEPQKLLRLVNYRRTENSQVHLLSCYYLLQGKHNLNIWVYAGNVDNGLGSFYLLQTTRCDDFYSEDLHIINLRNHDISIWVIVIHVNLWQVSTTFITLSLSWQNWSKEFDLLGISWELHVSFDNELVNH